MMNFLTNFVGNTSVSLAPVKPPNTEKIIIYTTYDQTINPLNRNTHTETVVIKKEIKDLTADICFKENWLPRESTDNNAIPKPPLK